MQRRLEQLTRHLGLANHASVESSITAECDRSQQPARLLSDDEVRRFIADGILALPVDDLPVEVHRAIHEHGWRLHEKGQNPGDGIYHEIPELEQLLSTSTVSGALTSLLGPGWTMASHRHMHTNIPAGGNNQSLHKDSQRTKPPLHRPRSLFIFYVPRGATVQMGPTAVVPSGHFVSADDQDWSAVNEDARNLGAGLRRALPTAPLEQGTIFLAHHGVIHGATARLEDDQGHPWRPMFKMIFGRRVDPTAGPSWDHRDDKSLTPFDELTSEPALVPAMEATWAWMCGNPGAAHAVASCADEWIETLYAPSQPGDDAARVGAAYNLGRAAPTDDVCLAALVRALSSEVQGCRRAAVFGLQTAGDAAVPHLLELLSSSNDHDTLMRAADALGEATVTPAPNVISALESTLIKLHQLYEASPLVSDWTSGQVQREQWMLDADTAATSVMVALSFIALRAVSAGDSSLKLCEQILEVLLPWLTISGPRLSFGDSDNNHMHGINYHGVHQAAVLAAAALCGLPAMASNETLEQALLAERGDGKSLSNHAHTAAGALRMLEQVKAGRSLQPFVA